jgi:polysaccharide biosynthesis/export protein
LVGTNILRFVLAAGAILAGLPNASGAATQTDSAARSGEITIALPEGSDHAVSFSFGDGKVSIDLPRGARLPMEFERESNGLLRSGDTHPIDDTHIRLDLKMASGVVDRIEVGASSVVVKLRRRFTDTGAGGAERDDDYRLGPDDKVLVSINGDPKLTQTLVVGPDGRVSFPLLGDVAIGGSTLRQATQTVTELLARDYLVDPKVDLQITEYKSQWVMVTGEVGKPGRVALRGGATLKDAISDADGMTIGAGDEIVISRDSPEGAKTIQIPIDRAAFERAEVNPPLKTGDIVNVVARPYVYVQGEVRLPGKVPLERGMTLLKAISIAGSLTEWASEKGVQIISEVAGKQKRVFNLKDIRDLKVPDPLLKGGDVIYVKRRFL